MNDLLRSIISTQSVTDGSSVYPLTYHIDEREGGMLQAAIRAVRPTTTLEIGMAYGISTLFICDALAELHSPATHIVIDPFQMSDWKGVGLRNVRVAGFEHLVRFIEERSEFILPRLVADGAQVQLALIDGWHSFDQALMEFYFINRLLPPGGIVFFDDADRPTVSRVVRYALTYPAYEVFPPAPPARPSPLGRIRRRVVELPWVRDVVHPSVRQRPWDLGIGDTFVALRKRDHDSRPDTWFKDF